MRNASFASTGAAVGPVTLDVWPGERAALAFATPREAAVTALLAAAIAKASSGCVLIADYDPRVQAVNCKRIAAFVAHEPWQLDEHEFAGYIEYRAALWNVDRAAARRQARELRDCLHEVHEAFAYPLIGALIAGPQLLVLDRPPLVYSQAILAAAGTVAVFSTHTSAQAAGAFAGPSREAVAPR